MAAVMHILALIFAGLFAGGAMMQTVVDHPARLAVGGAGGIAQMQRSLGRADPYMPILASCGAITCFGSFYMGASNHDLWAAILFVLVGIFTFAFIIPINKKIQACRLTDGDFATTLSLMRRWGFLHAFRSLAGTLALVLLAVPKLPVAG